MAIDPYSGMAASAKAAAAGAQGEGGEWLSGLMSKGKGYLADPGTKAAAGGMFGMWLLGQILRQGHDISMRNIQRKGIRSQTELMTPENLYYQAAQPQAAEEESMARQALFAQLGGGVLGPQLAQGEMLIGG